jgi:hypothetical protein
MLGPPIEGSNPIRTDDSGAPASDAVADSGSVVTRTYRPTSMSAIGLERLIRPLLTARGTTVTVNPESPIASAPSGAAPSHPPRPEAESNNEPDVLIVSDRPDAIGRIDALCQDLDATSPRIALDLVVLSVVPSAGRQLPLNQWRDSFGKVESDLPSVLDQIRRVGYTTSRASSQLQTTSGSWTELQWSEQNITAATGAAAAGNLATDEATREPSSKPNAAALTSLRIRPTGQTDGSIRIEVRAQSSRVESRAPAERPQLVTVRFSTQVVLREGATGVINLFVDEPGHPEAASRGSIDSPPSSATSPGSSSSATKIIPQAGQREQTLLLLMPRIAGPTTHPAGKVAASKPRNPA